MQATLTFTPSHFFKFAVCPHWIWHDFNTDLARKKDMPELAMKLIEQGVLHENRVIDGMEVSNIEKDLPEGEAVKLTLKLMQEGVPLIYQGEIQSDASGVLDRGRPDLLEKRQGKSKFGDWYYAPVEIKNSKEIKREHWMQLCLYGFILEQIQGVFPEDVAVINAERERLEFHIEPKHREETLGKRDEIIRVMKGEKPPLKLCSSCKDSPWFDECLREAKEAEDIALIYKLQARSCDALRVCGILTIHDAAKMDCTALPKIAYASIDTLERAKMQAQALVTNELRWMGRPDIPDATVRIYFDIEGDPLLDIEYLFGFWIVGDGEKAPYFHYFVAEQPEDDKKMWDAFLTWIQSLNFSDYKVYHYHHYERVRCTKLAETHGGSAKLDEFMANFVDLAKVVQETVIFPLYFYSIKDIAKSPFVNFKWRHQKAGGAQSIFWYEKWLETGDRTILQDIIDYNEDDVIATEYLHKWLVAEGAKL
ncbi:MAG: TM0106 family RecB-like putative nuclease [Candidatus Peribacter sp.]|jgi:uncharacterized protein